LPAVPKLPELNGNNNKFLNAKRILMGKGNPVFSLRFERIIFCCTKAVNATAILSRNSQSRILTYAMGAN